MRMPLSSTHLITWLQTGHIEARVLFPDRIGRMQEFAERFRPMICNWSRNSSLHALVAVEGRIFWYLSLRGSAGASRELPQPEPVAEKQASEQLDDTSAEDDV